MKATRIGTLDLVTAGGSDGDGGGDGSVVVLLHGFGAPGDDLVPLWRALSAPRGTRFAFPAAPLSLAPYGHPAGRAWWHIDLEALQRGDARLTSAVPDGLAEARAAMDEVLDVIERDWGVPPSRTVLGGFSQGAMLSMDVSLRRPRPLAGVALLSGTLIAEDEWRTQLSEAHPGPSSPIFQSHGSRDPLLPFATAVRLRDFLVLSGRKVTFSEFRGGHEIPPSVLDDLGRFLSRSLT